MKITKALITAAGNGTRFFPITKTVQKEMLPLLNRPLIDYVVDDCLKAGIKEIILVVRENDSLIRRYYSANPDLQRIFQKLGKPEKYQQLAQIHSKASFIFVNQSENDPYGTAVPLRIARPHLETEEAFLVMMGDDFIYYPDQESSTARELINLMKTTRAGAAMTCIPVPAATARKYGIAEVVKKNGRYYLKTLIEKPSPGKTSSTLANISKYAFTPQVFKVLAKQKPEAKSGELMITDTLLALAKKSPVAVHLSSGEYLDCGYPAGWLKANLTLALANSSSAGDLTAFLTEKLLRT